MDSGSERIWFANTSYESVEELAATFRQPGFYHEERAVRLEYYAMRIYEALEENSQTARRDLIKHLEMSLKFRLPIDDILADYFAEGLNTLISSSTEKPKYPKCLSLRKSVGAPRTNDDKSYWPRVIANARGEGESVASVIKRHLNQNQRLAQLLEDDSVQKYLRVSGEMDLELLIDLRAIVNASVMEKTSKNTDQEMMRKWQKLIRAPLKNSNKNFLKFPNKQVVLITEQLREFIRLVGTVSEDFILPRFKHKEGQFRIQEDAYGTELRNIESMWKTQKDRQNWVKDYIARYSN